MRTTMTKYPAHNHVTRDVKLPGKCPGCDSYWATTTHPDDGFARDIFMADNANSPDPAKDWKDATEYDRSYTYAIAAELRRLGYGKHAEELAAVKLELAAIKRREQTYVEQGTHHEMIPWYDLTDDERTKAIAYFGPEGDTQ
ncbi:hypothetical protein SEA_MUFASA8_71 [Arthrobacter phage Mufasa8]|uniref:Uncharacterized protein n=1 Tax=Arthrobacter phage Mufasa8 TaxID=2656526 RepID=A0A649VNB4_9CAUD|nr:hypothetical protein HYQ08_gp071 [Arthrobacter phage Mufasa8]QGJ93519.1 hypothetical protein SEA_MUFASA8_71 [Arthrobacter phage Mufasa8]